MKLLTKKELEKMLENGNIVVQTDILTDELSSLYMTATVSWKQYHGIPPSTYGTAVDKLRELIGKPTEFINDGVKYAMWGFKVDFPDPVRGIESKPFMFMHSVRGNRIETVHDASFGHLKAFLEELIEKLMPDEEKRAKVAWKKRPSKTEEISS